jgi:hypothetical protein
VLARPPTRRAIPTAANANRVVVSGGWYYLDGRDAHAHVAGFVLPGTAGAFSLSVIAQVLLINAASLCAVIAIHQLATLAARLATPAATASISE